jgi:phage anti-repressor protein
MRPIAARPDTWIPLHEHLQALDVERQKFSDERDRRYTEVKNAEEKALKIKEEADKVALDLAREIQVYKDEKANELREQINSERGNYATKDDLIGLSEKLDEKIKPLSDFVSRARGGTVVYGQLAIAIGLLLSAIALFIKL